MVAHQATIGSYIPGLNDAPRGKPSKAMVAALVLVSAAHAGLFAYLAYQKYVMPQPVIVEPRTTIIDQYPIDPPPQPEKPQPPRPLSNPPLLHKPLPTPFEPDEILPVKPADVPRDPGPGPITTLKPDPPQTGVIDPPPQPKLITRPNWLKKPGASEFSRFYPESAMRRGVGGLATLNCTVAANGSIQACAVVDETPAEEGFGNAAVKLSKYFRMSPQTENGQPVDGASVRIPIKFSAG